MMHSAPLVKYHHYSHLKCLGRFIIWELSCPVTIVTSERALHTAARRYSPIEFVLAEISNGDNCIVSTCGHLLYVEKLKKTQTQTITTNHIELNASIDREYVRT